MFNTFGGKVINWWRWGESRGAGLVVGRVGGRERSTSQHSLSRHHFPFQVHDHNATSATFSRIFIKFSRNGTCRCSGDYLHWMPWNVYLASFHFERIGHCPHPPCNVEGVVLTVAILSFANQSQLVTVLYKINVLIELKVLLFWDIAICASTRIWLQPRIKRWVRPTPLTSVHAWRSETSTPNNEKTNNERTPECWACHPFSLTSSFPPTSFPPSPRIPQLAPF